MPDPTTLDARLAQLSAEIDEWTRRFFHLHQPVSARFAALLGYPLGWSDEQLRTLERPAASGKRLRPVLCLLVAEAASGDHRAALAPAAAVELVHNFSLVHDDIQDRSPLRRGRPTVWARWNTAQAINVGDSLFALAQLALAQADAAPPDLVVAAVRELNRTCLRLVEGQYLDLELQENGSATFQAYQSMIDGKTAALLECAAWLGARYGGADLEGAARFAKFGRRLGLAFQMQDDLLGIWGDPSATGKSADTDLRTRKQSLPAVLALQSSGPEAERFRALFVGPGEMSGDDAAEALRLLEALGIRASASAMATAGYQAAAHALETALGHRADSPMRALLKRFEHRSV